MTRDQHSILAATLLVGALLLAAVSAGLAVQRHLPATSHAAFLAVLFACLSIFLAWLALRIQRSPARVGKLLVRGTLGENLPMMGTETHLDVGSYGDMLQHSSEMLAMLTLDSHYLYTNHAFQQSFRLTREHIRQLPRFESVFTPDAQPEAAALFRKAVRGESVERSQLRLYSSDGRITELELSLSLKTSQGKPLYVRCLCRDITQSRQRERRLGMQLIVSQVIAESTSPKEAAPRILESFCISLGLDAAVMWLVSDDRKQLNFYSAWGAPGRRSEHFIHESVQLSMRANEDLPGKIWSSGRSVWIEDLSHDRRMARRDAPSVDTLASGWGVPVRVGNKILAVVEFYSQQKQKEDRETMATVETVCGTLGQFIERFHQESRVRELNRQQEIILDSVADGILGINREGRITFANTASSQLLNMSSLEIVGMNAHELLHGSRISAEACTGDCSIIRSLQRQESSNGQDQFASIARVSFPVEFSLKPLVSQENNPGAVLSFRDISQRHALDRMKDEFISTVSHELRTPLTSIRGALGLLSAGLMGEMSDKATNLLRIAVSNSDRLVRLINDILDLERIQSGRAPLSFRRCMMRDLVQQAIDGMTPVAESANIYLLNEASNLSFDADPDRLLQVMTNLLSNAIKFSEVGSTVTVRLHTAPEGIALSVIDQGRGIPADKLESIFDRFQQVDASDSRQKGGTGLGLAICRTIVHQHAGRIWAERNQDRGSTFHIFLPFHRPKEITSAAPERETRRGNVLVADNDPTVRRGIALMLRKHGYQVLESESAEQTVTYARELPLEAILLDIAPTGTSGWQILKALRADKTTASLPVVVLSVPRPFSEVDAADEMARATRQLDDQLMMLDFSTMLHRGEEPARILLIEDDQDLAQVILHTFAQNNIEILHASTRREALDACVKMNPQLLLLDLALPDGDGFNIVDWMRQQEQFRNLPLVVYSATELNEDERRNLRLGPTQFLNKAHVQPQQVEALVLTMLRHTGHVGINSLDVTRIAGSLLSN